jgi:hypothetical protein
MLFDVKDTSFHRAQQKPTTRPLQIPVGSTMHRRRLSSTPCTAPRVTTRNEGWRRWLNNEVPETPEPDCGGEGTKVQSFQPGKWMQPKVT